MERIFRGAYEVKGSFFQIWEYPHPNGSKYFLQIDEFMVTPEFASIEAAREMIREFEG